MDNVLSATIIVADGGTVRLITIANKPGQAMLTAQSGVDPSRHEGVRLSQCMRSRLFAASLGIAWQAS